MADTQPSKAKRRVKDPETFRERAVKAAEAGDKPKRASRVKQAGGRLAKPAATPLRRVSRSKPGRVAGKVLVPAYLRNSWRELRKVTWLNWTQSRKLTMAVLIFAIIFGALIAGVDYVLDRLFKDILLK